MVSHKVIICVIFLVFYALDSSVGRHVHSHKKHHKHAHASKKERVGGKHKKPKSAAKHSRTKSTGGLASPMSQGGPYGQGFGMGILPYGNQAGPQYGINNGPFPRPMGQYGAQPMMGQYGAQPMMGQYGSQGMSGYAGAPLQGQTFPYAGGSVPGQNQGISGQTMPSYAGGSLPGQNQGISGQTMPSYAGGSIPGQNQGISGQTMPSYAGGSLPGQNQGISGQTMPSYAGGSLPGQNQGIPGQAMQSYAGGSLPGQTQPIPGQAQLTRPCGEASMPGQTQPIPGQAQFARPCMGQSIPGQTQSMPGQQVQQWHTIQGTVIETPAQSSQPDQEPQDGNASCCSSTQASTQAPQATGLECCESASPPECCLNIKPGGEKTVDVQSGGKSFKLSVKLESAGPAEGPQGANMATPCAAGVLVGCGTGAGQAGVETTPTTPSSPTGSAIATSGPGSTTPTTASSGASSSGPTSGATSPTGSGSGGQAGQSTGGSTTPTVTSPTSGGGNTGAATGATTPTVTKPSTGGGNAGQAPDQTKCQTDGLKAHNDMRSRHNSPVMTKDDSLNKAAQNWANVLASKKKMEHAPNTGQGENLAISCSSSEKPVNCNSAVEGWYDEIKDYKYNNPGFSQATGHFTQVVWKKSTKLGIAVSPKFKDDAGMTCYIVVARYMEPGNLAGTFQANVLPKSGA